MYLMFHCKLYLNHLTWLGHLHLLHLCSFSYLKQMESPHGFQELPLSSAPFPSQNVQVHNVFVTSSYWHIGQLVQNFLREMT